ncbi:antifreeze protein [Litorivita sp. NS0012-18]|uniref:antifreeze protein n=1 Tax=Litorivita sp. NS0012-18 TaxID=3127655 RepID=UPI0031093899
MKPLPIFSPAPMMDVLRLSMQATALAAEAQSVIAMRMMGMAGFWSVTPHEKTRMMNEKTDAFTEAGFAVAHAAMRGARADQIVDAGIQPLRRKTKSNVKRLTKRGPKLP